MSPGQKTITALVFTLILLALGTSDAILTKDAIVLPDGASRSSEQSGLLKEKDVFQTFSAKDITTQRTREPSLMRSVIPDHIPVIARVLLKDNDRIGYIAYVDSTEVKTYFTKLKEALQPKFSPNLKDLRDETQTREGKPVRDILTFRDPAIHAERLVFVRIRTRLYEFHVTNGTENLMNSLLDTLTE